MFFWCCFKAFCVLLLQKRKKKCICRVFFRFLAWCEDKHLSCNILDKRSKHRMTGNLDTRLREKRFHCCDNRGFDRGDIRNDCMWRNMRTYFSYNFNCFVDRNCNDNDICVSNCNFIIIVASGSANFLCRKMLMEHIDKPFSKAFCSSEDSNNHMSTEKIKWQVTGCISASFL